MVRRPFPVLRRLRAARGQIIMGMVWAASALVCGVLILIEGQLVANGGMAVAVVESHPIRVPESGRVATVLVSALQQVEAGATLATIEVPGLNQQLAAADADLRSLEAQIGAEEADRDRKFAKDLEAARASWLQARVELERERAELVGADQELARAGAPGVLIAAGEIDRLTVARDAARAAATAREAQTTALENGYDLARARAGLNATVLKVALESATIEAESLRAVAEANVLRAPVSGIVTAPYNPQLGPSAFLVVGEWVQAGVPVLQITQPATQDAVVFVEVDQARGLTPGRPVSLRAVSGRRYDGTIRTIGVAVEPVPQRQLLNPVVAQWGVPITVQVLDQVLTPGESLSVEF